MLLDIGSVLLSGERAFIEQVVSVGLLRILILKDFVLLDIRIIYFQGKRSLYNIGS